MTNTYNFFVENLKEKSSLENFKDINRQFLFDSARSGYSPKVCNKTFEFHKMGRDLDTSI